MIGSTTPPAMIEPTSEASVRCRRAMGREPDVDSLVGGADAAGLDHVRDESPSPIERAAITTKPPTITTKKRTTG